MEICDKEVLRFAEFRVRLFLYLFFFFLLIITPSLPKQLSNPSLSSRPLCLFLSFSNFWISASSLCVFCWAEMPSSCWDSLRIAQPRFSLPINTCQGSGAPRNSHKSLSYKQTTDYMIYYMKDKGWCLNRGIFLCTVFNTASSAAPHFHCVGGCWDRTQDCCDFGNGIHPH